MKVGEKVEAFMCMIDAQHHVPDDKKGVRIYFDLEHLKKAHPMYAECGVVKVNVEIAEEVIPQDFSEVRNGRRL